MYAWAEDKAPGANIQPLGKLQTLNINPGRSRCEFDYCACSGRWMLEFGAFILTPTKSRTGFCSRIENALPFSRANQNALDDPPSRFSARCIFKSSANRPVVRIAANSPSEPSEQVQST